MDANTNANTNTKQPLCDRVSSSLNSSPKKPQLLMPDKETKYGLTFGQIYSFIALAMAIIGAWIQVNMRIAALEVKSQNNKDNIEILRANNNATLDALKKTNEALNQLIGEVRATNRITNGDTR